MNPVSRRALLSSVGLGGAGLAAGAAAGYLGHDPVVDAFLPQQTVVPFRAEHQAGITTPAQDRLHMAAFDVVTTSREDLIALLKEWTLAAEAMTAGEPVGEGAVGGSYEAPPDDTGEALGSPASNLTITVGFGGSLFERVGLRLRALRPEALADLPHFPGDQLEDARSDGDLVIQACADDPQIAVHAIRNLARIGFGRVRMRWSQLGFGRTSSTSTQQVTPRNLFGFKDGTANLKVEEKQSVNQHLWVAGETGGAAWMNSGTYLVARRIRMHIEVWDRTSLREQEAVVGRTKRKGAPLSGGGEFSEPNFTAEGSSGPLIAMDSHVRIAHPHQNNGVRMLRRGYNYTDGTDGLGRLDAGLFFIAFIKDPRTHFVPMQMAMAKRDALSVEYLKHTGSGLFAVPPGVRSGEYLGQRLFDS